MDKNEKLLLIDTTKKELLVALVGRDSVEKRTNSDQRRHSVCLNDVANDFLPAALAFAVVTGTGSWTGSRVGVVAVKAWAFATGKPVIALTSDVKDLVTSAREKFDAKDFTDVNALAPLYDSEFKITPKNHI